MTTPGVFLAPQRRSGDRKHAKRDQQLHSLSRLSALLVWGILLTFLAACGTAPAASSGPSSSSAGSSTTAAATFQAAQASSLSTSSATTLAATSVSSAPASDVAAGQSLFQSKGCSACHGAHAEGNIGPKIAGTGLTLAEVLHQVRQPRGQMPPFTTAQISDAEVGQVYAYLESLAPPTATPAPTATLAPTVAGQLTATPTPKPVDVDSIAKAVNDLKVASDYVHDGSKTTADLKGYVGQATAALQAAQAATQAAITAGGGSPELKTDLGQLANMLARLAPDVQAAAAASSLQDAEPHTHNMVLASRIDLLPLAIELVRVEGETGSVTGVVKDTAGKPVANAFVTIEGGKIHTALLTDAAGAFKADGIAAFPSIEVKAYKANYLYVEAHAKVTNGASTSVDITIPADNNSPASPKVSNASATAKVTNGAGTLHFAFTATQKDNRIAEDQVWAFSPQLGQAFVLLGAENDAYAVDQVVTGMKPGTYTWYFFATTHECDMSNVVQQTMTIQ